MKLLRLLLVIVGLAAFAYPAGATVTTPTSSVVLSGNGATTSWPFAFPIPGSTSTDQTNIQVTITDNTVTPATVTVLTPSQFSVTGISTPTAPSSSGTVTYPLVGSPLAVNKTITIQRVLALTQTTSLPNQGPWQPKVVEGALDYETMLVQQIKQTGQGLFRGTWKTNTVYNVGDTVIDGANGNSTFNTYVCIITNTSVTWSTDLSAGDWILMGTPFTAGVQPFAFTPTIHPNTGGVSGANYVRTDQNAAFQDIDQISVVSKDPTTAVNSWTVSGTVATNDVVNLKITYTPQGGSQKTVTITVNVTAAISGASGGSPFVLNGFSATNPQYAIALQMQQNFRTNATLLADFGSNFINPSSFLLLNIALNNFPSAGTATFQFNFRYPEVATAGTTFQATVTTGAEVVTPSASTAIANTLENNPYYSLGRTVTGASPPPAGSNLGSFYVTGDDNTGILNTQYMNLFTVVNNSTNGTWQSSVTLGSGNWPLGTNSAALSLSRGLMLGSANVFPTGGDPGPNNINIAGKYLVNNGVASLSGPSSTALLGTTGLTINFGTANGNGVQVVDPGATIANLISLKGAAAGSPPVITNNGSSDANPGLLVTLKGTGPLIVNSNAAAAPAAITGGLLQISQADAAAAIYEADSFGAGTQFIGRASGGTNASRTALGANAPISLYAGQGFDGSAYSGNQANIAIRTLNAWTTSDHSTVINFAITPPGSTTVGATLLRLQSSGSSTIVNGLAISGTPTGTALVLQQTGDANGGVNLTGSGTGLATLGSFCSASGASPQTCNAQRGIVTTGTLTTAALTAATYTINDSSVTASSLVECTNQAYSGTYVTNGEPVVMDCKAGSGTITVDFANLHSANALNGTLQFGFTVMN